MIGRQKLISNAEIQRGDIEGSLTFDINILYKAGKHYDASFRP